MIRAVVISIIAILIAILLPALGQARVSAKHAVCIGCWVGVVLNALPQNGQMKAMIISFTTMLIMGRIANSSILDLPTFYMWTDMLVNEVARQC